MSSHSPHGTGSEAPDAGRAFVLVSNRGPVTFTAGADGALTSRRGAGGLVSGVGPLVAGTGTPWVAAAISDGDRIAAGRGTIDAEGFRVQMLAIDDEAYRLAYDVVSNGVLWFAHHGLWDLVREPAFDRSWSDAWAAYRQVNDAFAEAAAEIAPPGAAVLVQDYHLALVGHRLTELRGDLAAVHFSHTPFAPPTWMAALPRRHAAELLEGMAAHRACGFHTRRWADDHGASHAAVLGGSPGRSFVSPLASDPEDIRATATSPACQQALARIDQQVGDQTVIARVDRLELSKNVVRGFRAFDDLLAVHPEHRGRVTFVACCYPSRLGVPAYARYRDEVVAVVDEVNDRWARPGWTPIQLDLDDDYARSIALLRRADVVLVNPIRDGLNLVASEAMLVSERDAVLCLSPEAGAHEHLGEHAVTTPPFDVAGTADTLHAALTMELDDRRSRAAQLRRLAEARTPRDWLADQLAAAD
jgi:trehalose 6-phosphate synthase